MNNLKAKALLRNSFSSVTTRIRTIMKNIDVSIACVQQTSQKEEIANLYL